MQMVENIYQGMIADDPVNADYYRLNKESYAGELEKLDSYIKETLAGFSNRNFLIYHPAFAYFARDYNLTQIAVEHQGKEPTPQVIQTCIDKATQYNLNFVFVAPQFATSYAQTVADETGGRIIYVDPLAANYIANMRSVAASIALELE
jgi:zinc transport system substrate-binding protein